MGSMNKRIKGRLKSKLRNKRQYDQVLHADSDEVDLQSLLQIVNDISDMLDEEEKSGNPSKINKAKLNKTCVNTAVSRYVENSFRSDSGLPPLRPGTRPGTSASVVSTSSNRNIRSSRSRTPRMFYELEPVILPAGRKNMSFTNEAVREIDLENKRLLREILRAKPQKRPPRSNNEFLSRPSSSAINRYRLQQQIEKDNQKFLQRLRSVKPTKSTTRNYLLADHERTLSRSSHRRPAEHERTLSRSSHRRPCTGRQSKTPAPTKEVTEYSMNEFDDDDGEKSGRSSKRSESPHSVKSARSNASSRSNKSEHSESPRSVKSALSNSSSRSNKRERSESPYSVTSARSNASSRSNKSERSESARSSASSRSNKSGHSGSSRAVRSVRSSASSRSKKSSGSSTCSKDGRRSSKKK